MADGAPNPIPIASALTALPVSPLLQRGSDFLPTPATLPTGIASLDALTGGLALRRTHLLTGARGSGVTSLLHTVLATVTPADPVLLFDPCDRFFPPAAAFAGVHLPHLIRMRARDLHRLHQTLATALRSGACPLVVWDADQLPPLAFLDRLRPLVRRGQSAFLVVTPALPLSGVVADGLTLAMAHNRWSDGTRGRPGCTGRSVTVTVTDHQRQRTTTLPLSFMFLQPLPPLIPHVRKGGDGDAGTTRGSDLAAGTTSPGRRAG